MTYSRKSKIVASLFLLALLLAVICVGYVFLLADDVSAVESELSLKGGDDFRSYFTLHIDDIHKQAGINGMIDVVTQALSESRIDMYVCHSLAHDIGHYAGYPNYWPDIEENISLRNLNFCGSGFMHGVEGELANDIYPANIEKLYEFCRMILPYEPYYNSCYHGAGHAFMENERDAIAALSSCDLLIADEYTDVDSCYRGVFSQNAIYMDKAGVTPQELLEYCNNLPEHFHTNCGQELNGFELPPEIDYSGINAAFELCLLGDYSDEVKRGCVASVSGTAADRLLARDITLLPAESIMQASYEIQAIYIQGTVGAFVKTAAYNEAVSLTAFCEAFEDIRARQFCEQTI